MKPKIDSLILDLNQFKLKKCLNKKFHDQMKCFNYHFEFDKRRCLIKYKYENMLCSNKNCNKNCNLCHNNFELLYHPKNYKKTYCRELFTKGKCKYGNYCCFAHTNKELKINILHEMEINEDFFIFHYKTEFCPLPAKIDHNKKSCMYAHNYQDFRRKYFHDLDNINCEEWNRKKFIKNYYEGCKEGFKCKKCHGWKEKDYHIYNFLKFNKKLLFFNYVPKKRKQVIFN